MMPGDNMTSIVQRIARQALVTFRKPSALGEAGGKAFMENQSKLKSLITEVRAADLHLVPRKVDCPPGPAHPYHGSPPVTYMHICETDEFSMGVFLLKSGASIPLHDHPGMYGMLKVMYGKVRITCFDRFDALDKQSAGPAGGDPHAAPPPALPLQKGALRRALLRSIAEYTEDSGPCLLAPDRDNIHQIDAVDGPTAFMDILAPPYDPDGGRDCHYYKALPPVVSETEGRKTADTPGCLKEAWLVEISQPSDFWCGGEPYPGPGVSL